MEQLLFNFEEKEKKFPLPSWWNQARVEEPPNSSEARKLRIQEVINNIIHRFEFEIWDDYTKNTILHAIIVSSEDVSVVNWEPRIYDAESFRPIEFLRVMTKEPVEYINFNIVV